jgi:hypothetical protein
MSLAAEEPLKLPPIAVWLWIEKKKKKKACDELSGE